MTSTSGLAAPHPSGYAAFCRPAGQRPAGGGGRRGASGPAPGDTRGGRPPRYGRRRERYLPDRTEGWCAVKSFVTGAAGFIGSHLTTALLSAGHEVVGLDDLSTGRPENLAAVASHPGFRLVEGSILDQDLVDELTTGADRVFHFAAAVGSFVIRDRTLESLRTNIRGTENVVEAAHRNNAGSWSPPPARSTARTTRSVCARTTIASSAHRCGRGGATPRPRPSMRA